MPTLIRTRDAATGNMPSIINGELATVNGTTGRKAEGQQGAKAGRREGGKAGRREGAKARRREGGKALDMAFETRY
jgi:hypothetical protein